MQQLKCLAEDCAYNSDLTCSARAIRVNITGRKRSAIHTRAKTGL
jgi:hypothetical protein